MRLAMRPCSAFTHARDGWCAESNDRAHRDVRPVAGQSQANHAAERMTQHDDIAAPVEDSAHAAGDAHRQVVEGVPIKRCGTAVPW